MEIIRRGASYNYGLRTISLNGARFSCDGKDASIKIEAKGVKDFSGQSHHDYTVIVTSKDLVEVFEALAVTARSSPDIFEKSMAPALRALLQIQHAVAGLAKSPN